MGMCLTSHVVFILQKTSTDINVSIQKSVTILMIFKHGCSRQMYYR